MSDTSNEIPGFDELDVLGDNRTWEDDMREMNERTPLPAQPRKVKSVCGYCGNPKWCCRKHDGCKALTEAKRKQGRTNKRKGDRGEREVVKGLEPHAVRGFGDRVGGDVRIKKDDHKIEVKCEKAPFKRLYKLIAGHWAVAFRGNNQEWLVTIRLKDLKALLDEQNKPADEE